MSKNKSSASSRPTSRSTSSVRSLSPQNPSADYQVQINALILEQTKMTEELHKQQVQINAQNQIIECQKKLLKQYSQQQVQPQDESKQQPPQKPQNLSGIEKDFTTPNPFAPLATDEENIIENMQTTQQASTPKPPPIYVKGIQNYMDFCHALFQISGNNFECKSRANDIMILARNVESYRVIIRTLHEKKADYHTFQLKEDKAYRVVIRHLHPSTDTEAIKEELKTRGFSVRAVHNALHPVTKAPLPLFFVDLEPNRNNIEIFNISHLLYTRIKVEEPKKQRTLVQCKRCQQYGHTKTYCQHQPRCVKCAGQHLTEICKKMRDTPAKCALCQEAHPANYRGCVVHKELQKQRRPPPPIFDRPSVSRRAPAPQHSEEPILQPAPPPPVQQLSYSQAARGSVAAAPQFSQPLLQDHPQPATHQITNILNDFLSDFKATINPLLTLLTTVISHLVPHRSP